MFFCILVLIVIGIGKTLLHCVNPLKKVSPSIKIVSYCLILMVGRFRFRHQVSSLLKSNIVVFSMFDVAAVALLNYQSTEVLLLFKVYVYEKSESHLGIGKVLFVLLYLELLFVSCCYFYLWFSLLCLLLLSIVVRKGTILVINLCRLRQVEACIHINYC